MGQQIGIAFSQREELEFCEAIRVKFDIWSVPRCFKKAQGIPKPLGEYMGMDQKMFFETERINVKDNTHQITSTNWETMVETLTDDYHLYSNDPFYIDWDTANIEKYVNENHKEYLGKMYVFPGRFYLHTNTSEKTKAISDLKKLYSFITRHIRKSCPYMSTGKRPLYFGKEFSELLRKGEYVFAYEIVKNPHYKDDNEK
jgi:hypothetical protein